MDYIIYLLLRKKKLWSLPLFLYVKKDEEIVSHLLFSCQFTRNIQHWLFENVHIRFTFTRDFVDFFIMVIQFLINAYDRLKRGNIVRRLKSFGFLQLQWLFWAFGFNETLVNLRIFVLISPLACALVLFVGSRKFYQCLKVPCSIL